MGYLHVSRWIAHGLFALLPVLLSGCFRPLRARIETCGPWMLPSAVLETPDPLRHSEVDGERLVVSWSLGHRPAGEVLKIGVRLADTRIMRYRLQLRDSAGSWMRAWPRRPQDLGESSHRIASISSSTIR